MRFPLFDRKKTFARMFLRELRKDRLEVRSPPAALLPRAKKGTAA